MLTVDADAKDAVCPVALKRPAVARLALSECERVKGGLRHGPCRTMALGQATEMPGIVTLKARNEFGGIR